MEPTDGWQPILEGDLADQAVATVRRIGDALAEIDAVGVDAVDFALFWAYAAGAMDDELSEQRLARAGDQLAARFEAGFASLGLYGGLAGAGWVVQHIGDDGDEPNELLAMVDDNIVEALDVPSWTTDYDLIGGLVGYGVYFIERLNNQTAHPAAIDGLGRIVGHLEASCEHVAEGITWHTAPELLPDWQREHSPAGYYNLGLAHGVPGVIGLLGLIQQSPAASATAGELLDGAVRWVLSERLGPNPDGRYAASVSTEQKRKLPTRTAWCYGDPGVAAALWTAGRRTGKPEWEADAIALAKEVAARDAARCGVVDAGLCHGSLGLAHLYNRWYQASGDTMFRDAALDWIARGLAHQRPGEGIAGFLAYRGRLEMTEWAPVAGFLEGTAGIGLALLSALGTEPSWDRLLLCDIPEKRSGNAH